MTAGIPSPSCDLVRDSRTARMRFPRSHVDISVARQGIQWGGRGRDLQFREGGREKRKRRGG